MVLPDRPQSGDPGDWNRWRGTIDQKLDNIETDVEEINIEQRRQHDLLLSIPTDVATAIKNGEAAPSPGNGTPITFKWMAESLTVPILMLVLGAIITVVASAFLGFGR